MKQVIGLAASSHRQYRFVRPQTKFPALVLLLLLIICLPTGQADTGICLKDTGQPRVTVVLFQYAGAEHGDEAKNFFSRFSFMLRRQLETIPSDISYLKIGSVNLATLRVFFAGQDTISNLADRTDYSSRDGILEMLRGEVQKVDQRFEVTSYVFLGDRQGKLTRPEIAVSMPIHTGTYANTRDGFALITTYALAIDAYQRQCPSPLIIALIQSARNKIKTIEARGGEKEPAFEDIKLAIQALEMELTN